jgi:predicted Zn-dependent protease
LRNCIASIVTLIMVLSVPAWAHPGIDEQIDELTARIASSPDDATLYLRRGELHRIHRDWKMAEADYKSALQRDGNLVIAEFCLGRLELEAGDAKKAKGLLDNYLAERPTDPTALATRAKASGALGLHLEAAEDYTLAIQHAKSGTPKPEYYLARARELAAAGPSHLDRALEGLDEGMEALGFPVTLQLYAIDLELERKGYDAALARLDRVASESVRKEPWLVRKAAILEAAGRPGEARQAYEQTLASLDSLPSSRRGNRAVVRLEDEARHALERLSVIEAAP